MKAIDAAVEKYRALILEAERYIWKNPETGYKEYKTSKYMEEKFRSLGYELTMAEGITGFYTVVDTGREGPEVLILGELDSVICPTHPEADPTTGAVHSCGHNAQCAALLGIAAALKEEGVLSALSGRIRLCAVPAEELLEIEYRASLRAEGKIRYYGGKSEFLARGYFDGADLAFMMHTAGNFNAVGGAVGCLLKTVTYKGLASHAGGCPEQGKNALYAATCGLNAINAVRETFHDEDHTRVHPIITRGGDMVNAIPETVTLESYVRGRSYEAITRENEKVNRALCGAALSLGNNIEIVDYPGYSPLVNCEDLLLLAKEAADAVIPEEDFQMSLDSISKGSTDMGELCCVMPVIHPYVGGARGHGHGNDYEIVDAERACVKSAKWQLALLKLLLENGGARAKEVIASYKPPFASKEEYFAFVDGLIASGDRIDYSTDGRALVRLK